LDEKREGGPAGFIGLAISARMSEALHATRFVEVPESGMKAYGKPEPDVDRECAEVVFVSTGWEPKGTNTLRYVAIRLRKRQGGLFADGSRRLAFCRAQQHWTGKPVKLIEWHREKAGRSSEYDVLRMSWRPECCRRILRGHAAWYAAGGFLQRADGPEAFALPARFIAGRPKRCDF